MLLRKGDNNENVKLLQKKLGVDPVGNFGPATEAAVKAFQAKNGLVADGIVGDVGVSRLVSVVCDYVWDHICGEPDDLSVEQLYDFAQKFLFQWFEETTQEQRSVI